MNERIKGAYTCNHKISVLTKAPKVKQNAEELSAYTCNHKISVLTKADCVQISGNGVHTLVITRYPF